MKSFISELIAREFARQESTISLIASENYASNSVLRATGSVLTNKYAEGYPGRRYYGGCEVVDQVEICAMDTGKRLFETDHMNVQPHSGSTANMVVYFSQLNPGDTVLGMSLQAGGHLTHGHKLNFSGKLFNFVSYSVSPEDELIDYDEIDLLAAQHKPKMIVAGTSAYSRIVDYEKFHEIAKRHRALLFVDMAHVAGLIAARVHPSPMPFADIVSSTTHKTLRGPRGGFICCKGEFAKSIDRAVMPGCQGGPLMHVIAAKGVAFEEALRPEFKTYQEQVLKNAKIMSKMFVDLGYRVVSGGTDTHLFLLDTKQSHGLTGDIIERALGLCNIIVNRNSIPFDTESPLVTSGIRIGTPAITTRGFGEREVVQLVHWIDEAIKKRDDDKFLAALREQVVGLCKLVHVY
ncbi:serine hydroxymethyltransferase [Candidatus Dependentiae bacterium]|nr:serine hydroxymethyltransferase [Candidatus Dependentiae bacterium]